MTEAVRKLSMPKVVNIPETGVDYENLQAHPLADLLPMIEGDKATELKKSIEKHGLEQKLILFAGNPDGTTGALRWLDGRNRRRALKELGRKITAEMVEVFEGTYADAKAKVFNLNLMRRQLTPKQLREVIKGQIAEQIGAAPAGGYTAAQLEEVGQRAIAKIVQCSASTVASVLDELREPPELKRYRMWLKTWEKDLKDELRLLFVKNNAADLRDMLNEVGASKANG